MASPFTAAYDEYVNNSLEKWHCPGLAVAVVHGSETWTKGYGFAQQEPRKPVEPTTLFYVASTTKAQLCAAWAIYIASEANQQKPKSERITWSTPLANIIPADFVLSDPIRTAQVTLEDAASHRTGLPRHEASYGYAGVKTPKDVTMNLRNLYMHNELRTKFEYCNTPFVAASHALETLTGRPLVEVLRESLWQPLGMMHTYGGYGEASVAVKAGRPVLAKGTVWSKLPTSPDEVEGCLFEEDHMDFPEVSGAGWAISCADDYAKWMRCWLEPSDGPLTENMIKELWSPRSIVPPDETYNERFEGVLTYSLGWFVSTYQGHMLCWHTGGLIGAGSYVLLCPDIKWGISFFANTQDASFKLKGLAVELLDAALGIPDNERTERAAVDDEAIKLYEKIVAKDAEARDKLFPRTPDTPNVPLSRPIEVYTGTYCHTGYGPLTFTTEKHEGGKDFLNVDMSDRTWKNRLLLQNVNGENWLVTRTSAHNPMKSLLKAESKVGADGSVRWGIAMEPAMPDVLTWFAKTEQ